MKRSVAWLLFAPGIALAGACGGTGASDAQPPVACGPGTALVDGDCTASPAATCGPGTEQVGSVCVAIPGDAGPPVDAGPIDASLPLSCGPGTYEGDGGVCLPLPIDAGPPVDAAPIDASLPVSCGPGTYEGDGGVCLPLPVDAGCPAGSVNLGGACIATDDGGPLSFAVRAPLSVPADGYSLAPVLALGPAPGGAGPAVVLAVTPPLGALTTATLTLGSVGATTYYRPCDSTSPACTGSVRITMALAGAPGTIVATSDPIALTAPSGVGTAAPCLLGGANVLFFNGDPGDLIHPGIETLTAGGWSVSARTYDVDINMTATGSNGAQWGLTFSTQQLGQPLAAQVYTGAERAPFASAGSPGLEIWGNGLGCNTLKGSFQIEELNESDAGTLQGFTATFEQHCDEVTPALRGCVHYGQ